MVEFFAEWKQLRRHTQHSGSSTFTVHIAAYVQTFSKETVWQSAQITRHHVVQLRGCCCLPFLFPAGPSSVNEVLGVMTSCLAVLVNRPHPRKPSLNRPR